MAAAEASKRRKYGIRAAAGMEARQRRRGGANIRRKRQATMNEDSANPADVMAANDFATARRRVESAKNAARR